MSKPGSNLAVRIRKLREARERATKLKRGTVLDSTPMSELIGVQWTSLRGWLDAHPSLEAKGAVIRGGNGVPYEFKPLKTIDMLLAILEKEQQAIVAKGKRVREIVGGSRLSEVPAEYSLAEIRDMLRLSAEIRAERVAAGELVSRAGVMEILRRTFSEMLQAGLTAAQRTDPNGQWSPAERAAADKACELVLSAQEMIIERDLGKLSGSSAHPVPARV